ncbi:MAG TPA: S8 family serine peptidase, partial [Actinomycetes bacterium]|nr:S8 family serine peptidase [Actinomycetes bacterium]
MSVGLLGVAGPAAAGSYDPRADMDSMLNTTAYSGAQAYWKAGFTGKGVDVAVIDTGVTPVEGLNTPGKVVNGPDLSFESQRKGLQNLDANGHGTFMAGLIAGRDSGLSAPYIDGPASAYRGMAPDARIVNMKVGSADGAVDVSQVIAAIDWVVEHKDDNGLNIRVLTLAYGTDSTQDYRIDPLAHAVERAWNAGIFVAVAAGNEGYVGDGGKLASPCTDPFILCVGASQSNGTATIGDDLVAPFSAIGNRRRYVDLVAPGTHIQGLRVPGAYIDQKYAEGRLDDRFFRGSGTSEATAIVSGAAALVIQQRPSITPDELKLLLLRNAQRIGQSLTRQGMGELNLTAVLNADATQSSWRDADWREREWRDGDWRDGDLRNGIWRYSNTYRAPSTGTGSLEAARGSQHVILDGVVLEGEQDIFGHKFDAASRAQAVRYWVGGDWNGNTWSGNTWSGNTWSGNTWSGNTWSGNTWS